MNMLILFDIDGTILKMKYGISKEIFSGYLVKLFGREIDAKDIPAFHGMTDMQIIKEIADNINYPFEKIEAKLFDIWKELSKDFVKYCTKENIELMPGIENLIELLAENRKIKLGLLTGNIKSNAYAKLDTYNLSRYFPIGAFGDDHFDRNALPAIAFERANKYYKNAAFDVSNSMLVGDSPRDIECGHANSIVVFAVATGGIAPATLKQYQPDYIFDDFSDWNKVYTTIINHFENGKEDNHSD